MTAPGRPVSDQPVRADAATRLRDSFLLQAGAGTGKTTVLLSRVLEIVKTETPLERIAVITFTEKAAGELKLRLREEMEKMLRESSGTPWGAVLADSLEALDRATISTIHSFAASLLRERPVEAGVDPRFSVADELTAAILMEECWERWLEREMAAGSAPLERALRSGVTVRQVRRLAADLAANRDVAPPAPGEAESKAVSAARDRILEAVPRLVHLADACQDDSDGALRQIRDLAASAAGLSGAGPDRTLDWLATIRLNPRTGARRSWRPADCLVEAKSIVADLASARDEAVRGARSTVAHQVAAWIRSGCLKEYRAAKEARRLLDFADILIVCRNMLRDSPAARVSFQQRFDSLLVDEFQDTDPLQSEILFLLAADDPAVADWRLARPRPGKLFVVGDPKQSIYRFRRADIEVYEEAKALIAGAGGITDRGLVRNFRTVPSVVAWVNDLFGVLIGGDAADRYQPAYQPIEADRPEPGGDGPRVALLLPAPSASLEGASAAEVRRQEALHVTALVKRAIEERWPVHERGSRAARPLRWRDVALLFRTGTAFEIYEEALRDRGIPYRIAGGRRYYMRSEMRSLQAVLAAIEGPHDPLAVVSALRCPFFGHSDEELLSHAAAGGDWVFTKERAGAGGPLERSFELLARLHALRGVRPVAETLEHLYEASGALALFFLKPDGEQRAANLLKAIDLARTHAQAGGATFGTFARWLGRMAEEERDEAEAPLTEETEHAADGSGEAGDAVRVLTVHKAKGLEYPVVILCDAAGRTKSESPSCIVERTGEGARIEFRLGPADGGLASAGYEAAAEREKARLRAEAVRLFYVAATRARDHLVIPVFAGGASAGFHAMLADAGFLPEAAAAPRPGSGHRGARLLQGGSLDLSVRPSRPLRLAVEEADAADPSLRIEKEAWRRSIDLVLKAPPMGRHFITASGLEAAPDGGRAAAAEGGPSSPRSTAAATGRATHAVLERIDLATGRDIGVISEEEAARVGRPDLASEVRRLAESARTSRIVKEALAAPRIFRELALSAAGETWLTEDRLDLVFESGGAFTIVDFKTDQVSTEAEIAQRVERYRPQALLYARALSEVTSRPVSRVVLLFVRPGVERSLKVDAAFLAEGRRLLERRGPGADGPNPLRAAQDRAYDDCDRS